jgi:hypothetical protein
VSCDALRLVVRASKRFHNPLADIGHHIDERTDCH